MKVIDLLNKIANNEEVPKEIKIDGVPYHVGWSDYMGDEPITNYYNHGIFGSWFSNNNLKLDTEIEIIKEKPKKIEKLDIEENAMNRSERYIRKEDNKFVNLSIGDYEIANKVNEIIDYLLEKDNNDLIERIEFDD